MSKNKFMFQKSNSESENARGFNPNLLIFRFPLSLTSANRDGDGVFNVEMSGVRSQQSPLILE
jgi:hypothetical protein